MMREELAAASRLRIHQLLLHCVAFGSSFTTTAVRCVLMMFRTRWFTLLAKPLSDVRLEFVGVRGVAPAGLDPLYGVVMVLVVAMVVLMIGTTAAAAAAASYTASPSLAG